MGNKQTIDCDKQKDLFNRIRNRMEFISKEEKINRILNKKERTRNSDKMMRSKFDYETFLAEGEVICDEIIRNKINERINITMAQACLIPDVSAINPQLTEKFNRATNSEFLSLYSSLLSKSDDHVFRNLCNNHTKTLNGKKDKSVNHSPKLNTLNKKTSKNLSPNLSPLVNSINTSTSSTIKKSKSSTNINRHKELMKNSSKDLVEKLENEEKPKTPNITKTKKVFKTMKSPVNKIKTINYTIDLKSLIKSKR